MAEHFFARIINQKQASPGDPHSGTIVTIELGIATPGDNGVLVPDALEALAALSLQGGAGIRFTGRISLPVAMALSHAVAHLYGYVAMFDPKLEQYVVAVSHKPGIKPGDLLSKD